MAGLRDRARDLRQLQLVREEPRRDVPARLPPVEDDEPEEREGERDRAVETVEHPGHSCGGAEDDDRVEVGLAPDEAAGDPGCGAGAHDGVEPIARLRSGS